MGLLSALKRRFVRPELCRVAKDGDVAATIQCLARTPVVVIGADLGNSAQLNAEENEIIAIVEAAAQKQSFDGDVHKYEIDGDMFLPVFTDVSAAESFCGAYVDLLGQIHAFRLFRVPGTYLHNWISDDDFIVVNPQSNNEVEIDRNSSKDIRDGLPQALKVSEAEFLSVALPMAGISQTHEVSPNK